MWLMDKAADRIAEQLAGHEVHFYYYFIIIIIIIHSNDKLSHRRTLSARASR